MHRQERLQTLRFGSGIYINRLVGFRVIGPKSIFSDARRSCEDHPIAICCSALAYAYVI